jgi:membrane peptidoglycan carboxypeptidase
VTTAGRVAEWESGDTHSDLPAGRPGRRRRGRWVAAGLAIALLVVLAGTLTAYLVTPSVSGAPALVRAQDAGHHAGDTSGPVPSRFARSLIATEDRRFYSEPGIDPIGLARVAEGMATRRDLGGSTLSVQLAKMLYTPGSDGLKDKAEQGVLAVKLNMRYSKASILRMYANVVYFGNGYYGLNAASCGYFGIEPGALSWGQAAFLAGLVQGPAVYDPRLYPALAREREQHVLDRVVATGQISSRQAKAVFAVPVRVNATGPPSGCR